ncbi:MAG: hypothetical protein M3401_13250 [Actinomycetota bacterium]|nr:hypothetical protein [Actinomycetota bacterium]
MDLKIILWSVALFFGSGLVFRAIDNATSSSPLGVRIALQAAAMALIIGVIVLVVRRTR